MTMPFPAVPSFAVKRDLITEIPDLHTPAQGVDFLAALDRQQKLLEDQLAATKRLLYELSTQTLVQLFDRFEQPSAVSNSGAEAKRKMIVTGSLPKPGDKDDPEVVAEKLRLRAEAIDLAVSYGWSPFIKSTVSAQYDKGDREKALDVYNQLRGDNSASVRIHEDIHPMTLQSQVRKRLREGKAVNLDALGVSSQAAVVLTQKQSKE